MKLKYIYLKEEIDRLLIFYLVATVYNYMQISIYIQNVMQSLINYTVYITIDIDLHPKCNVM